MVYIPSKVMDKALQALPDLLREMGIKPTERWRNFGMSALAAGYSLDAITDYIRSMFGDITGPPDEIAKRVQEGNASAEEEARYETKQAYGDIGAKAIKGLKTAGTAASGAYGLDEVLGTDQEGPQITPAQGGPGPQGRPPVQPGAEPPTEDVDPEMMQRGQDRTAEDMSAKERQEPFGPESENMAQPLFSFVSSMAEQGYGIEQIAQNVRNEPTLSSIAGILEEQTGQSLEKILTMLLQQQQQHQGTGQAVGGIAGSALGSAVGGPVGGAVGGMAGEALGGAAGEALGGRAEQPQGADQQVRQGIEELLRRLGR